MLDERIINIYRDRNVTDTTARDVRNRLLADTDYLGLSDRTMTSEMAVYRQVLRDLPSLDNWPLLELSEWPTFPVAPS